MTELRRLLDGDSDELALALLRSADDDSPSGDSLKAAALALGIGGTVGGSTLLASGLHASMPSAAASGVHATVAGAPAGAATVASITVGAIVKQVAIGIAAGVLTMGGAQLVSDWSPSSAPKARLGAVSAPLHAAKPAPLRVVAEQHASGTQAVLGEFEVPAPAPDAVAAAAPLVRRRSALSEAHGRTAKVAEESPPALTPVAAVAAEPLPKNALEADKAPVAPNKSLAAEVALLDRARNALLAQNPSAAVRALEQYRKERQTAILEPEASVLEIHVLDKLGNHAAAVRAARAFVQSHPASAQADSLRALAAEQ